MGRGWIASLLVAGLAAGPGCVRPDPAGRGDGGGIVLVDDAGRTVRLEAAAGRVLSLVPSVTETIVALGAGDRLVGRTRYDTDPALAALPEIGGGLDPSPEAIVALDPDLVVAWAAVDDRGLAASLEASGIPVYGVAVEDTADLQRSIRRLGDALGLAGAAAELGGALSDSLAAVAADSFSGTRPRVLFALVGNPPRTAGPATFVGQIVGVAGGRSAFADLAEDWPIVSLEAVVERAPDVVVVPTERPGTAADLAARPGWRDLEAVREGRVVEIPADLLARPGPDLARAARRLRAELGRVWPPRRGSR